MQSTITFAYFVSSFAISVNVLITILLLKVRVTRVSLYFSATSLAIPVSLLLAILQGNCFFQGGQMWAARSRSMPLSFLSSTSTLSGKMAPPASPRYQGQLGERVGSSDWLILRRGGRFNQWEGARECRRHSDTTQRLCKAIPCSPSQKWSLTHQSTFPNFYFLS